jgi:peptidoglycan hydrolase CwlO-like protein
MKINKQDILLIIIVLLAGYSIFQMRGIKTDIGLYNSKIDAIQTEIDSIQIINEGITEKMSMIDNQIDNIDGDINNVTKNINIIKKQTNEKIDSINNFNFSDLEKFFAERYKDQY